MPCFCLVWCLGAYDTLPSCRTPPNPVDDDDDDDADDDKATTMTRTFLSSDACKFAMQPRGCHAESIRVDWANAPSLVPPPFNAA